MSHLLISQGLLAMVCFALVYMYIKLGTPCFRMLAYKLDVVSPNDIIITADVDAFIGTPHILDPLNQV